MQILSYFDKIFAKVDKTLNWEFKPLEKNINVKIGENKIIKYWGKNLSNKTITSTADFKVKPEAFQAYLIKSECFCFKDQFYRLYLTLIKSVLTIQGYHTLLLNLTNLILTMNILFL